MVAPTTKISPKIALCLYGIPKESEKNAAAYKNFIMTNTPGCQVDIYAHFWDIPADSAPEFSYWLWNKEVRTECERGHENAIVPFRTEFASSGGEFIYESDPPKTFDSGVSECNKIFSSYGEVIFRPMVDNAKNFLSQMYSRQRVANLFAGEVGGVIIPTPPYDWVITGRFDVTNTTNQKDFSPLNPLPPFNELDPNHIYVSGFRVAFHNDFCVPDNFMVMSPSNYLKIFNDISDVIIPLYTSVAFNSAQSSRKNIFDPESLVTEKFIKEGLISKVRRRLGTTLQGVSYADDSDDYNYYASMEFESQKRLFTYKKFFPIFYETDCGNNTGFNNIEEPDLEIFRDQTLSDLVPEEIFIASSDPTRLKNIEKLFPIPFPLPKLTLVGECSETLSETELHIECLTEISKRPGSASSYYFVIGSGDAAQVGSYEANGFLKFLGGMQSTLITIIIETKAAPDILALGKGGEVVESYLKEGFYEGTDIINPEYGYFIKREAAKRMVSRFNDHKGDALYLRSVFNELTKDLYIYFLIDR